VYVELLMSIIKAEDAKKWINALIACASILLVFVSISFTEQVGEWFDLEARVPLYSALAQFLSVVIGVVCFLLIYFNKKASMYLDEVYGELVKVVWPEKDSIVRLTVGIIIGLTIVGLILVLVDFAFQKLLGLLY